MNIMKILVADDSPLLRKIITRALKSIGAEEIIQVGDGEEAFRYFQKHDDLSMILTDYRMPKLDGMGLIAKIRETNKTIPVIMITSHAGRSQIVEALERGATDYIIKPFKIDSLLEKIKKYM